MDSQKWSSHLVMLLLIFVAAKHLSNSDFNVIHFVTLGVLFLEGLLLWLLICKYINGLESIQQSYYRPNTSLGVYTTILVPITLLGNVASSEDVEAQKHILEEIWLSLTAVFSFILWLYLKYEKTSRIVLLGMFLLAVFMFGWRSVLYIFTFMIQWKGISVIPAFLPKTFTLGEISVVLQLASIWINRTFLALYQQSSFTEETYKLFWFNSIFVAAIVLATTLVCFTKSYQSLVRFITIYIVTAVCALLLLYPIFNENPVTWFFNFLSNGCGKLFLMVSWIILCALTIVWTVFHSLTQTNNSTQAQTESKMKEKFIIRKMFHLFIILVYIPGLVLQTHLLLMASVVTFGLFFILETSRALQVPLLGKHLHETLKVFVDDRDQGLVFLTHIYLLIGLSVPIWLSPHLFTSSSASIEMYSGVLSLGIGDTAACLFGSKYGRLHYPGSKKTIEGTLASIGCQILAVMIAVFSGIVHVNSPSTVLIGISLSSLFEAITDQIDNLMLPLALYPVLCYS